MISNAHTAPALTDLASPPRVVAARFRTTTLLRNAHGLSTWLGVDLTTGRSVVIKAAVLRGPASSLARRLEHDAEALRDLDSPFVAPVIGYGREGDAHHLVMPRLDGVTLEERLRRGALHPVETLEVARCLSAGLEALHGRGVLHRDVKPANILLGDASRPWRATLIDLGLARSEMLDVTEHELAAGTARYMSPEQAGFLDREVAAPSDLYALGAVLFECLAGEPPFPGERVGEILRQHLVAAPPELRARRKDIPAALDGIVQRLLRKDPRDRYQSASALRGDVESLVALLEHGVPDPELALGTADARATVTEPGFIGRAAELARLDAELARAREGEPTLTLLEAPSGGGKSRLLDEWAQRCRQSGAVVLRGQGVFDTASRPFRMLAGVAEGLLGAARLHPGLATSFVARLGDAQAAARDALPELAPLLPHRDAVSLGPEDHGETRSLSALATLLDALGTRAVPAVLLFDDAQWADEMTVKLLAHWRRPGPPSHVAIVVAFRSEEVEEGHALRALPRATPIVLPALAAFEIDRIAESAAGKLPDDARALIRDLSEGNPFMVCAVVGGLVEAGTIVRGPNGWRIDPEKAVAIQSSRKAAAFLRRRLALLPEKTRALLTTGAVLGKEYDLELAGAMASLSPDEAFEAHEDARQRHLVWRRPRSSLTVFVHDKLREALLAEVSPEARRELHLRAAVHIETYAKDRIFDLAHHFDAAGEPRRALPYALEAAERARAQHALEASERLFRIAERADDPAAATRQRVAEALGEISMLRGNYGEAERQLDIAQALATDNVARAKIAGKLGELAFKRGDVRRASASIERGLRLLHRTVPVRAPLLVGMLAWEIAVQLLHTLFPRLFVARRAPAVEGAEMLAVRLYSRLAYAYWFQRGKLFCLWAHLREMNLAERYPPTAELAQAYSEHAPVMTMVPYFERGIAYAERSFAIRTALGDVWGQGQSLHFHGIVLYASARFEEAIEKCREAIRLLERTGDRWEVNTAEWHIAFSQYRLGDLDEAVRTSQHVHAAGRVIGDPQATGISLGCWAKASEGRIPEALVRTEVERGSEDVHTFAEVLQAEAVRHLAEGRPAEAVRVLDRADRLVRAKGLQQDYVAPIVPFLAGALRESATHPSLVYAPKDRAAFLRRAVATARRARRISRLYPNNRPHALRESALVAALLGKAERARVWLDESLDVAEKQKMRFERVLTLEARAAIARALGWPDADPAARAALESRTHLGRDRAAKDGGAREPEVLSLSLADRFPRVLDAGRRIASALSREAVLSAVRDAALALLRGERCIVAELAPSASLATASHTADLERLGEPGADAIVCALLTGRVVVVGDGLGESDTKSLVLSDARSALAAPILVRGRAAAYFYVTHERVGHLFGAVEERLAEFIATLAGAALENTDGFEEVASLSEERARLYAEAQEALSVRDDFIAIASHELKTPLSALQLNASFLTRSVIKHGASLDLAAHGARLAKVEAQAARLAKLIDDLLDISRITHGRLALEPEEVDLAELAREVTDRLRDGASRAGSELRVVSGPPLTGAWDRSRLDQILTNLCTNAIKFGGGKPIDVVVEPAGGGIARVVVVDRGIGISKDDQARIFERFERAVSLMNYGGFGLGLWIVRQIAEAMGGTIIVQSQPGRGSRFVVELPRRPPSGETVH